MKTGSIPYYFKTLDWDRLVRDYPPPPDFFEKMFYDYGRADIERVQEERLLAQVQRAWEIPFYRRLWTEAGVSPTDIKGLGDLRKLPIYNVDDYRASIARCPPFGDYQGATFEDVRKGALRIFTSGGTTGRARPMIYTLWDWEVYTILLSRIMYLQGLRPGDPILNISTYGLHVGGMACDYANSRWLSCVVIPVSSGNVTPTRRQVEIARDWGAVCVVGYGDQLVHWAAVAREMGIEPSRDLAVRFLSVVSSPRRVEAVWGLPAYDWFGANEYGMIATECHEKNGLHIWDDAIIAEIVDADALEPLEPGQKGDLVITALYKSGSPVIRFNTRDVTKIMPGERCGCGSYFTRMDHHLGRSDTMVKLRGLNVWPEHCGEVVRKDPRVAGEYFCYVERVGSSADPRDEMTVMVEHREGETDLDSLKKALEARLKQELEVRLNVEVVPPGSLAGLTGLGADTKIRRLDDRRPKG